MATVEEVIEELRKGLKIDVDSLDEELVTQPDRYDRAGRNYARVISRRDKKDNELEVLKATLDKEIREQAAADEEKITEPQIKQSIQRDPDYIKVQGEYFDLKRQASEFESLRDAYKQRAYILGNLVDLYSTGYFGDMAGDVRRKETVKRNIKEQVSETQQRLEKRKTLNE